MIRNVVLKKFLMNTVSPVLSFVNKIVPKDDVKILIHCSNDRLRDNSEAVYNYLIDNEYYKKYRIIVSGDSKSSKYRSDSDKKASFVSKFKGIFVYLRAGYVFYCSGKIPINPARNQMVINLMHGIPMKTIGQLSKINNGTEFFFTHVCASSEFYRPIIAKAFGCPEGNVCICGEPKTDKLFIEKENHPYKLIVWTPTFRRSKYYGYNDSSETSFLPFLEPSEWESFNEGLKARNVKLVVKLHPGQDLGNFTEMLYSNMEIYGDKAFQKEYSFDLYELLSQSDALISDYSSVPLEYLVIDRPIGFALSDLEDYKNTRGFVFENPLEYMPGKKIFSKQDLVDFIDDIANGLDEYKTERARVNSLVNQYKDGKNCERVLQIAGIYMP